MKVHTRRRRAGFSLTELLVVIGIIGILMGLAIPAVLYYQRELKLTELDDNARAIFIATQNHLTALRSANAGELEVGTGIGRGVKDAPGAVNTLAGTELKYVSTDVDDAKPGWLVLPGSIEGDLAKGHYLVEFDPKSGSVYGVFFTQDTALGEGAYQKLYQHADNIRARAGRKSFASASGGFFVGYYGADGALDMTRPDAKTLPKPKVKLTNAEELVLEFSMDAVPTGIDPSKVFASVSVSDGTASKVLVDEGAVLSGTTNKVVLDTLKSYASPALNAAGWTAGNSFAGWMASGGSYVIAPGKDVAVTVSIFYYDDAGAGIVALPQSASVNTNSLFAARSGDTAQVAYGRHLQNLHPDASHLDSAVTKAQQVRAIDFAKTGGGLTSWADTYGSKTFAPITNGNLTSYDGSGMTIASLNVNTSGNAGLFGTFTGNRLENVTLVDAVVNGGSDVGALAGRVENATVSNCRAYMTGEKAGTQLPKIKGSSHAGGLMGSASNVTVENGSFASVYLDAVTVGGLVGRGEGPVTVKKSYAAGWLSGTFVGGLVGRDGSLTIEDCYAAGSIAQAVSKAGYSPEAGGLSTSSASVQRSYAAVEYGSNVPVDKVYGTVPGGSAGNVYYLVQSGVNDKAATLGAAVSASDGMKKGQDLSGLGAAFIEGDDSSVTAKPYNLNLLEGERDPRLEAPYPYPTLKVTQESRELKLPHYGDWLEAEGSSVTSLVAYYEQFLSDSGYVTEYSAFVNGVEKGAIKDAARTEAINADGYAFLSTTRLSENWEGKTDLTIKAVGMVTVESTVRGRYLGALDEDLQPTVEDGAAYYAYAIPGSALDVVPDSGWYNEVTVKGTGPQVQWNVPPEEVETNAWVNPLFGRSAYNGGAKPTFNPPKDKIHIRSLRQLANIGRFFGDSNYYVQDLDIDASVYYGDLVVDRNGYSLAGEALTRNDAGHVTVAGFEMWTRNWDKTWGYWTEANPNQWNMPSAYHLIFTPIGAHGTPGSTKGGYEDESSFNATYDGNDRTIRALSIRPYYYAEDKAYHAGLFHRVRGTLCNIHMYDCDIIGAAGDTATNSTGALAARLSKGEVNNCTVTNCTVTAQGTKANGHMGGLIGYVDNEKQIVKNCTVENCAVIGGDYIRNVGGLIGHISKLNSGGVVQDCTVKNVQVSSSFTAGKATDSIEKRGSAGGFVGCIKDSTGMLENCAVIGTGNLGVSGSTWNTGGFAGSVSNGNVRGCAVRLEGSAGSGYDAQVVRGSSYTGGFVGTLSAGSIQSSYAAVKVSGATAGGFVGSLEGGSVSNCYAGGRTKSGKYSTATVSVTGTSFTGGLAGTWKGGSLDTCYTTCAVSGPNDMATDVFANQSDATAGSAIPNCYALGEAFVNGSKRGSLTKANVATTMTELNESQRTETHPYDTALTIYPYAPVKYADGTSVPHYGDWPEEKQTSGLNFEWQPEPQSYIAEENPYRDVTVNWKGDDVLIKVVTHTSGTDLGNAFNKMHIAITTDLGYVLLVEVRRVDDSAGTMELYIGDGEKLCEVVPDKDTTGEQKTYNFSIPTSILPPYKEAISMGGYKDGYIVSGITNTDTSAPSYQPTTPLLPGDTVTIGDGFEDWLGYSHEHLGQHWGQATTSGHDYGAAFGKGNMIYLHLVAGYPEHRKVNFTGELRDLPVFNAGFEVQVRNGEDISTEGFIGWFVNKYGGTTYIGPGSYTFKVWGKDPNNNWAEGNIDVGEAYLTIDEDGTQEVEMSFDLEALYGEDTAGKITQFQANFGTMGGSLTIYRDPSEDET